MIGKRSSYLLLLALGGLGPSVLVQAYIQRMPVPPSLKQPTSVFLGSVLKNFHATDSVFTYFFGSFGLPV